MIISKKKMIQMLIDPKVRKLDIFNGGGAIIEREIKLSLNQGINKFEIANVPASFDPNSADIKLDYITPEDKEYISLQQTIVSLPDKNNSTQLIVLFHTRLILPVKCVKKFQVFAKQVLIEYM